MIVANVSHTLINFTCKNRLGFSLLLFALIPHYLKRFNWSIQQKSTHLWLVLVGFHDFQIFPDGTPRAWSVEVGKHMFGLSLFRPSRQSNPSPRRSHVGRRKSQISPPPGEQDWSNVLNLGQQKQSNPHTMPCLPLCRLYIGRCIT